MRQKASLKQRIFINFFLLISVIVIVSALVNIISAVYYIKDQTNQRLDLMLVESTSSFQQWLDEQKNTLTGIADEVTIRELYKDPESMKAYLAKRMEKYPHIKAAYMGTAQNVIIDSTYWVPKSDFVCAERDWYKNAVNTDDIIVTNPYVDSQTGDLVMTISKRVMSGNQLVGVAALDFNINTLTDIIKSSKNQYGAYAFVLSKDNTVLMHPDEKFAPKDGKFVNLIEVAGKQYEALTSQMANNEQKVVKVKDFTGAVKYFKHAPIDGTDWRMVINYPSTFMRDALIKDVAISILLFVASVAVAILAIRRFSKIYLSPIETISEKLNQISVGTLSIKTDDVVKSSSEIISLSESLQCVADTLTNYIAEISNILSSISSGDLTVSTGQEYIGDFKDIQHSLDKIINSLNETFSGINHSANLVLTGSEQIASSAQILAQGSAEQTSSIERLSDAANTLNSDISNATEHARGAGDIAKESQEKLQEGNAYMQELLLAMKEINDKSTEISKIMKTIDDIAFQTNILALNAAVEAARAGSAGKGFAVVADEVRTLANRCAEASQNTAHLISSSIASAENGSQVAEKTATQLQEIIEKASLSSSLVMNISETIERQSKVISHISNDSMQISAVVQTNSALAQESAASSEELSSQAHLLKQLVSFFHVNES